MLVESLGSVKVEGRSTGGTLEVGVGWGRGIPLSMRSWIEGGTSFSLALICQTELNLASFLQVENSSSNNQRN